MTRVGPKMAAGGAVGAVLGGRGACGAPKWELYVFHKEIVGFLRAGELPGASGGEVLASFGALLGVPGRPLGAGGGRPGSREERRGSSGRGFGRSGELIWRLRGPCWRPWS